MIDLLTVMADFAIRQAKGVRQMHSRLQHLKNVVIPPLREAGITKVEVRFDGGGDGGAVEECMCFDAGEHRSLRMMWSGRIPAINPMSPIGTIPERCRRWNRSPILRSEVLSSRLGDQRRRLRRLVIDVTEASFVLDCQLRYTATHDHSTQL